MMYNSDTIHDEIRSQEKEKIKGRFNILNAKEIIVGGYGGTVINKKKITILGSPIEIDTTGGIDADIGSVDSKLTFVNGLLTAASLESPP